jgi:hypothetical protein
MNPIAKLWIERRELAAEVVAAAAELDQASAEGRELDEELRWGPAWEALHDIDNAIMASIARTPAELEIQAEVYLERANDVFPHMEYAQQLAKSAIALCRWRDRSGMVARGIGGAITN